MPPPLVMCVTFLAIKQITSLSKLSRRNKLIKWKILRLFCFHPSWQRFFEITRSLKTAELHLRQVIWDLLRVIVASQYSGLLFYRQAKRSIPALCSSYPYSPFHSFPFFFMCNRKCFEKNRFGRSRKKKTTCSISSPASQREEHEFLINVLNRLNWFQII